MQLGRVFAGLLALALAACATRQLNEGLKGLMGQNIQTAVSRLGYPDGQRTMMGNTIYIWSGSHSAAIPLMTTSSTSGMVGGTPVYGTTTNTNWVPVNYNCTIQIATDSDGVIKSYQWSGNEGGCRQYANAISR